MPPAKRATTTKSTAARTTAAKKPAAKPRAATASTASKNSSSGLTPATRRRLELAAKRLEKSLGEAGDALTALGKDASKGAKLGYKELAKGLKAMQREVAKTNKLLEKDFEQLVAAVTPSRPAAKRTTAAKRTSAAKRTPARSAASKSKPAA